MKVGDTVLIQGRSGDSLSPITRETKTQWVVEKIGFDRQLFELKFSKDTLFQIGGDKWFPSSIRKITDEEANKIRVKWAIDRRKKEVAFSLSKINWSDIQNGDLEILEEIMWRMKK
jgi:hypothetical protein